MCEASFSFLDPPRFYLANLSGVIMCAGGVDEVKSI